MTASSLRSRWRSMKWRTIQTKARVDPRDHIDSIVTPTKHYSPRLTRRDFGFLLPS
jgi:hypothetical protein